MKIISTSYSNTPEYHDPVAWLQRISFYTGLLDELAKQHQVASIERISYEGRMRQREVDYFFIDLKKKVSRFPIRMHRLIKSMQPDVVLVNGFIFPFQIIQLRMQLQRKVKIIVLHRAERPFRGLKGWIQKKADACVDAYLFSSKELAAEWIKKGNISSAGKIHEVMQASSCFSYIERPQKNGSAEGGGHEHLWVGRLEKNKDPLTVVRGFIRFLDLNPSARLRMIFPPGGLHREVMEMTAPYEAIQLVGKAEKEELQKWYNSSDFIVSGSHYEGGGTAITEAMSCGCIPVVTDIPSFRAITGYGRCGLVYEPGNEESLASALAMTLKMDIEAERRKVLEQFKNELSFKALASKLGRIIG